MDNYTKGVLTVIAVALMSISFQLSGTQTIKNAYAHGSTNNYNPDTIDPGAAVCTDLYNCENEAIGWHAMRVYIVNK